MASSKSVMETKHEKVLQTLAHSKALSMVELMSLVDVPDGDVENIVKELEQQKLVSVSGDQLDRIVTIRSEGLKAAG